ncbi:MAG: type II toxin-antitoxin system VapC family toxin [Deltaproteobacteria bacterium]|nr:type II toxin-antitoxin system VapC family toxin [Deltaproteobacteria bacterium]
MRLLLDTHAFLWWLAGSRRLSTAARRAIENTSNDVVVSAASAWEITTKHRVGKLPEAEAVALDVSGSIAGQGFDELAITVEDAERAGRLPGAHRDPFDRVLIAQALAQDLTVVSIDRVFDGYGVFRLW